GGARPKRRKGACCSLACLVNWEGGSAPLPNPPPKNRLRGQSPRSKRNTERSAIGQERHARFLRQAPRSPEGASTAPSEPRPKTGCAGKAGARTRNIEQSASGHERHARATPTGPSATGYVWRRLSRPSSSRLTGRAVLATMHPATEP